MSSSVMAGCWPDAMKCTHLFTLGMVEPVSALCSHGEPDLKLVLLCSVDQPVLKASFITSFFYWVLSSFISLFPFLPRPAYPVLQHWEFLWVDLGLILGGENKDSS